MKVIFVSTLSRHDESFDRHCNECGMIFSGNVRIAFDQVPDEYFVLCPICQRDLRDKLNEL